MSHRLYEQVNINAYNASGATTPMQTTVLDMDGYEGVLFIAASTATSTAQHLCFEMGTGSATAVLSEATGRVEHSVFGLYLDVYRPQKRYVMGKFTSSGATGPSRALVALRYGARNKPTTMSSALMAGLALSSPGSGTATG
jgi:hypothetical protein